MKLVIAILLLASCTLKQVNYVAAGISVTETACDWGQTRKAAILGWSRWRETNVFTRPTPSVQTVDLYNGSYVGFLIVANTAFPEWVKSIIYASVIIMETEALINNYQQNVPGVCGMPF